MELVLLTVRVAQEELDFLDRLALQHEGILSKQGVVRLLLQQAAAFSWDPLDKLGMLGGPSAAGTPSTSSSSSSLEVTKEKNKSKAVKSRKSTSATPEFEAFWRAYQSSPSKANCQSKAKAWEVWKQLVDEVTAERLLEAAQMAVKEVQARQTSGEFCAPLPDCFRWLRDERYAVLLENHAPAREHKTTYL
jgi:hypothetical protein